MSKFTRSPQALFKQAESCKLRKCLHPLAANGVCSNKIIEAHTISRSSTLSKIANKQNKVLTFHRSRGLQEGTGIPDLKGWREASTFTGFCAKHDSELFAPIETREFLGTPEQCFLVGYRALCHENYQKEVSHIRTTRFIQLIRDERPHHEAMRILDNLSPFAEGLAKGLADTQEKKKIFDQIAISKDYSALSSFTVSFDGELTVASTGAPTPNYDLKGNQIQVLHDFNSPISPILFGPVGTPQGATIVFNWPAAERPAQQFMDSLMEVEAQELPRLITQLSFFYLENTFFSQQWWNSLSKEDQTIVFQLASNVNPYYQHSSLSKSLDVPWTSLSTKYSPASQ